MHLDEEECQFLIDKASIAEHIAMPAGLSITSFICTLGGKIKKLLVAEPGLLEERTPEAIAAILAKESEKAALQLKALQSGAEWKKVDPDALNAAMSKLVNKQ